MSKGSSPITSRPRRIERGERQMCGSERRARPAFPARPEALTRRKRDAVLCKQLLDRQPLRQPEPDVERAFADRWLGQSSREGVTPSFIGCAPLLDGVLRPFERSNGRLL